MVTENINIDVRPGGIPIVIHVTQYEVGLRQFVFTPYTSNGTQTIVAGSATLEGTKPDGYAFQQACQMIDGVITYTLQEQLCAVEGRIWSRLVVRDASGGMIGYTAIVWVVGCAGVKDDAVMSDSDISALRQFLDEFGTIDAYRGALNGALAAVGGPLVASTATAMTDRTKVYVYTGSESGYTEGHWYYWNGSAWTDGGVYQATGINTDKTLTVEDMAADAKVTGDAVAELKNDLNGSTIYNYTDGKNIDNNGALVDATGVCVSDKIPYIWTGSTRYYYGEESSDYVIAFYSSDDTLLQKFISSNNNVYRSINAESQVTGTVSYVRFSFKKNYSAKVTRNDSTELPVYWSVQATQGGGLIADVAEMQTDIEALQETAPAEGQIDAIETTLNGSTTYNYTEGKNLNSDGNLVDDPTSCVSDKIPYTWSGSTRYYYNELSTVYRIAFYGSDDSCLVSRQSQNNALYRSLNASELTESTVSYIRFSFKKSTTGRCVQNANPEPDDYWTAAVTHVEGVEEAISRLDDEKATVYCLDYKATEDTLATGTTMSIATNVDNRKHDTIDFRADITSFTSVTVGHGYQINHGMWVTVDGTNITTYDDEDGEQVAQQAHGLTISDFIHVLVIRGDNSRATIEVITGGGMYRWENVAWSGNRGSVFAFCTGTLTNAKLNAVFRDMNSLIFMYGDSYQSFGDQARYPYYLVQDGFTDFLAAGFPGANAAHGIAAFRAIIAKAKPKYVVWALGMNNSDTSSAVNAYWKTATDEVIATCDANNITLILTTTPNVPERIHTFKNDYVRNSGKRYIDFAKAVGAESQGSTWYTGMLSSDNVHPTDFGAKALYTQLLADFPEIMK